MPHLFSQMGANGKAKDRPSIGKAKPKGKAKPNGKANPKGKANAQGKADGQGQAPPKSLLIQVLLAPEVARDGAASSQARPWASMLHKLSRTT